MKSFNYNRKGYMSQNQSGFHKKKMIPRNEKRMSANNPTPRFADESDQKNFTDFDSFAKLDFESKSLKGNFNHRTSYNYDYKTIIDGSAGNFIDEK